MLKLIYKLIVRIIDGALYGFIGPFSVLYLIPQFLMKIAHIESKDGFGIRGVETVGIIFLWSGAALAIYCTILLFLFAKGTPVVTLAPKKILAHNIYAYIRNPMMWSLLIVILGEALTFGQWILFIWLIALFRISCLIVVNYEEPQLERRFGEDWKKYCQKVPRWLPRVRS